MSVTTRTASLGFPIHTLSFGEDEAVVSAFGGQILSWTKRGIPIVFENRDHALMDGRSPYRGGAPICFPYFNKGTLLPLGTTLLPQHGASRTSLWDSKADDLNTAVEMKTQQPAGEGYGPTEFACELVYTLSEKFQIQVSIRNIGKREAPFQFAVHTYWATDDPSRVVIKGLGNRYLDNLLGLSEQHEIDSSVCHVPPIDRIYLDAADQLELKTEQFDLTVSSLGGSGAVVWNPGKDHGIKDLGAPNFICLESGVFLPGKSLGPGEEHKIEISYEIRLQE